MRRGISGAVGCCVTDVAKVRCSRKPISIQPAMASFRRRVRGATIVKIGRIGKRVAIWLDSEEAIVVQPRMTGLVLIADPPSQQHLRWRLELAGGPMERILYWDRRGLGNIRLFSRKEFNDCFRAEVMGPDALVIDADGFCQQLGHSQREIKTALLDQRAVAGIGNLYASEILHVAGIHPQRRCAAMTARQWRSLAAATHQVMEEAIRYEGSTLGDGTYRNVLNQQGKYQHQHRVYKRTDQPCPRCHQGPIKRIVQTQRSTFFCPSCQKRSGAIDFRP